MKSVEKGKRFVSLFNYKLKGFLLKNNNDCAMLEIKQIVLLFYCGYS